MVRSRLHYEATSLELCRLCRAGYARSGSPAREHRPWRSTRPSARHSRGPCQLRPAARPRTGCSTTCAPSQTWRRAGRRVELQMRGLLLEKRTQACEPARTKEAPKMYSKNELFMHGIFGQEQCGKTCQPSCMLRNVGILSSHRRLLNNKTMLGKQETKQQTSSTRNARRLLKATPEAGTQMARVEEEHWICNVIC